MMREYHRNIDITMRKIDSQAGGDNDRGDQTSVMRQPEELKGREAEEVKREGIYAYLMMIHASYTQTNKISSSTSLIKYF